MKKLVIYIHGKGGNQEEAKWYIPLFQGCDVVGMEYLANTPWEAKSEFVPYFERMSKDYDQVVLIGNSIGAYFAMHALQDRKIEKAYFISPIVDMETLIRKMMSWANVTEGELKERGEIETEFHETLSWEYLLYVKNHPIEWRVPTHILYGERDHLTSLEEISSFAKEIDASLTVMPNGEHWFHTEDQMTFLARWIFDYEHT